MQPVEDQSRDVVTLELKSGAPSSVGEKTKGHDFSSSMTSYVAQYVRGASAISSSLSSCRVFFKVKSRSAHMKSHAEQEKKAAALRQKEAEERAASEAAAAFAARQNGARQAGESTNEESSGEEDKDDKDWK